MTKQDGFESNRLSKQNRRTQMVYKTIKGTKPDRLSVHIMSLCPPLERHFPPHIVAALGTAFVFMPAPSPVLACTVVSLRLEAVEVYPEKHRDDAPPATSLAIGTTATYRPAPWPRLTRVDTHLRNTQLV